MISHTTKRLVIAIGILWILTPVLASAQSATTERIALLQQLLVVLEAQLELLLEQAGEPALIGYPIEEAVFSDQQSFVNDLDAEIVARYQVNDMQITTPSRTHARYLARMAELIPDQYEDYLAELVIFEAEDTNVDAFVETLVPYQGEWRYGVNEAIFQDAITAEVNTELIVHEFAHIFSLDEVYRSESPTRCHEFFSVVGCVDQDTLYGQFLDEFWTADLLDDAQLISESRNQSRAVEKFYNRNSDSFVTRYAASSPAEDFAESFTHFVLFEDDRRGAIAEEKVSFFNRFSYPRALKAEIEQAL